MGEADIRFKRTTIAAPTSRTQIADRCLDSPRHASAPSLVATSMLGEFTGCRPSTFRPDTKRRLPAATIVKNESSVLHRFAPSPNRTRSSLRRGRGVVRCRHTVPSKQTGSRSTRLRLGSCDGDLAAARGGRRGRHRAGPCPSPMSRSPAALHDDLQPTGAAGARRVARRQRGAERSFVHDG